VNVVQWLNTSLETLSANKAKELEPRLERLTREVDHDAFDAVMFELTAAARYAEQPTAAGLEFIAENPQKKTPDFVVRVDGAERSVECKKIDRAANFTVLIRNAVRDHLNEVKWKVSSEEVVARYRRFAFDGVFKGIEQLKGAGPDSTVHLWLESEYHLGRGAEVAAAGKCERRQGKVVCRAWPVRANPRVRRTGSANEKGPGTWVPGPEIGCGGWI
jgi:hypothetical protein